MKTLIPLLLSAVWANAATLTWDALPANSGVVGYNVQYGTSPTAPNQNLTLGNVVTTSIALAPGSNTYFRVTGRNATGVNSGPSNQVQFVMADPTPTPMPTPTPIPTPIPSPFVLGDRITTIDGTNVRSQPLISPATLIGMNPPGTQGQLIEGPATGIGIIWWRVNYDGAAFDGWSGEDNFAHVGPTPTPTPIPTPSPTPSPPVVALSLSWDAVPHAAKYMVYDGTTPVAEQTGLTYSLAGQIGPKTYTVRGINSQNVMGPESNPVSLSAPTPTPTPVPTPTPTPTPVPIPVAPVLRLISS